MLSLIISILRRVKLICKVCAFRLLCILPSRSESNSDSHVVFITGCGRSGTTYLGSVFESFGRGCRYLFEPYALWYVIRREFDLQNLFSTDPCPLVISRLEFSHRQTASARKLLRPGRGYSSLVEKTPHNAMRIPVLAEVFPGAKFLHLTRHPFDVAASISALSLKGSYKIFYGGNNFNQWWGREGSKRDAIITEAIFRGLVEKNLELSDYELGLLEWIITEQCIEDGEARGFNILRINYNDLLSFPDRVLSSIQEFTDIKINITDALRLMPPTPPSAKEWPDISTNWPFYRELVRLSRKNRFVMPAKIP